MIAVFSGGFEFVDYVGGITLYDSMVRYKAPFVDLLSHSIC